MEAALRAGRVDAVPLAEPFWTWAGSRGDLHVISYYLGDAYPDLEIAGWFTLASWQRTDPETAKAVDAAFRDAVDWLLDPANEASARQIIAQYTGTDSTTAMNMAFPTFRRHFTVARLQEMVSDMLAHGFLDAPIVVDSTLLGIGN
jgi:ABC-type nitrate/sulfonate/bicarbonate transport system substrate-binding protein